MAVDIGGIVRTDSSLKTLHLLIRQQTYSLFLSLSPFLFTFLFSRQILTGSHSDPPPISDTHTHTTPSHTHTHTHNTHVFEYYHIHTYTNEQTNTIPPPLSLSFFFFLSLSLTFLFRLHAFFDVWCERVSSFHRPCQIGSISWRWFVEDSSSRAFVLLLL